MEELPLNGRRYTDLALLTPGVTQDPRSLTSSSNGDMAFGGVRGYGAIGVGGLKMKIHKACIARLFERNDLVLDAESIADVASELTARSA